MSGMLGWMSDALGLNEEEEKKETAPQNEVEPDHIDAADIEEETEIIPDDMLSKEHLYDIFSSFKALVTSEDGKKRLQDAVTEGKQVEDVTNLMQQEIATGLGLDGKKALDMFKHVLKVYKDDEVLCEEFIKFCESESMACDEAELGPEKLKEKIKQLEEEEANKTKAMGEAELKAKYGGSGGGMMRQLKMLQASPEEFGRIMDGLESNMRQMMKKNPKVGKQMISQLESSGIKVKDGADPIKTSLKQVRDAHSAMKDSISKEAAEKKITFDEVVEDKMKRLEMLQQKRKDLPTMDPSGLRFPVGSRIEARITPEGQYAIGDVIGINVDGGDGTIMPYKIQLLGGQEGAWVFAPGDSDFFVRTIGSTSVAKSNEMGHAVNQQPGMPTASAAKPKAEEHFVSAQPGKETQQPSGGGSGFRFGVGTKVECRVTPEGKYAPGVVQRTNIAQPNGRMPYQVMLNDGNVIVAPMDVDYMIRRAGSTGTSMGKPVHMPYEAKPTNLPKLRFAKGERVECRITNEGQFAPGTVVNLHHREPNFPPGQYVPYQISLDNGMMIFAPQDVDPMIRKLR